MRDHSTWTGTWTTGRELDSPPSLLQLEFDSKSNCEFEASDGTPMEPSFLSINFVPSLDEEPKPTSLTMQKSSVMIIAVLCIDFP
jgi:hypothetical protein